MLAPRHSEFAPHPCFHPRPSHVVGDYPQAHCVVRASTRRKLRLRDWLHSPRQTQLAPRPRDDAPPAVWIARHLCPRVGQALPHAPLVLYPADPRTIGRCKMPSVRRRRGASARPSAAPSLRGAREPAGGRLRPDQPTVATGLAIAQPRAARQRLRTARILRQQWARCRWARCRCAAHAWRRWPR